MENMVQKFPNRNLLHNWDFRNPVNQRGKVEYTAAPSGIYTIDRFLLAGSGIASIASSGITIVSSGALELGQRIENSSLYAGKALTVSVEVDGIVYSETATITNTNGVFTNLPISNTGYILQLRVATYYQYVIVAIITSEAGKSINISQVKLELGSVSTLANDPPMDYGAELAKCQRYYYKMLDNALLPVIIDNVATGYYATPLIQHPVQMRVNPTISNVTIDGAVPTGTTVTVTEQTSWRRRYLRDWGVVFTSSIAPPAGMRIQILAGAEFDAEL